MTPLRPCSPAEAVQRALAVVGNGIRYGLGKGGYSAAHPDSPFADGRCDCSGLVTYCYRLPRGRPGFNRGSWATVSDDLNTDSIAEDAEHRQELFRGVDVPAVGDILVNPAVRLPGQTTRARIGHTGIIVAVPAEWQPGAFASLTVVQCFPRLPPVQRTDGHLWAGREHWRDRTDAAWRTRIVRVVP